MLLQLNEYTPSVAVLHEDEPLIPRLCRALLRFLGPQADWNCYYASGLTHEGDNRWGAGSLTVTQEWKQLGIVTLASNRSVTLRAGAPYHSVHSNIS